MKITRNEIGILLGIVGILAAILAWRFIYQSNIDKTEAVNQEIVTLKERQDELKKLEEDMPFYQEEIVRMEEENDGIVDHFPANVLPEDQIMYAVAVEDNNEIYFTSLSYGSPNAISTGYEDQTGVTAYAQTLTAAYQSTYDGLKNAILYNAEQNNRQVINSVSASFDASTGELVGSMSFDQYYMTGTDQVYTVPYIPALDHGVENIFGSMEIKLPEEDTEAVTEETEDTEEIEETEESETENN